MAYKTRNLNEGETIALDLRPHWWTFALPAVAAVAGLVLLVLSITQLDWTWLTYVIGALIAVAAVWLVITYLDWASTAFVVTNRRLIYSSGVLAKHGIEIPLDRVNNVIFSQTLRERVFGSGDLIIESAGESGQQRFSNVRDPQAVQNTINRQMEALENDRRGPGRVEESLPDQIAKLAALRNEGVLTDAEFESKKRDLLDRM